MATTKQLTLDERIEAKKALAAKDWQSDRTDWQWITIPEENAIGQEHATVSVNDHEFLAGQTYQVPPKIAETVRERLRVYTKACVRILQPKRDVDIDRQLGTAGRHQAQPVNPASLQNDFSGLTATTK